LAHIDKDLIGAVILGDDNLSIVKGKPRPGLREELETYFRA